jgi:23S rRNA (cytosine1962-C5)-methyltransferase
LSALKAGVEHVTFVDASVEALNLVRRGLELNKIPATRATFHVSDVFDFLEKDTATYDVIVADPPAFVKSKKTVPQGLKGYEKLNRLAWRRLKDDGRLMTCSCSYHVSEADFMNVLHGAVARENDLARVAYRGTQSTDHPILLSMPETHYLKCVGLEKIPK